VEISIDSPLAAAALSAIHTGALDELQDLVARNPNLPRAIVVDPQGVRRTMLHIATDWPGHLPNGAMTVAMLIAAGADVNAVCTIPTRPEVTETPLHWAASTDDVEVIDALLDGGADLEAMGAVFTGGTAMSDAVVFAQWRAARRLLERGARTTLWQAAALGLIDRVETYLVSEPAPAPQEVTNAFWHACRGGQEMTARQLLARGAELNWIGYDHKTPLGVARESGCDPLIAWLCEQGAK
jgi:ankyrin repeat protein